MRQFLSRIHISTYLVHFPRNNVAWRNLSWHAKFWSSLSVSSLQLTATRQLTQSFVLAGYRHLREVDKAVCISFCLQDPNCTAVTYSVHKPPHASSLCKFYSTVDENVNVHLNLTKRDGSDGILSDLILFISKLQDVHLIHAKLEGNAYFSERMDQSRCNSTCTDDLFCDAFSFSYTGSCSMYSTRDITNIVVENDSEVTFIGLHSN